MKPIYLSWLLIVLQVCCQHHPRDNIGPDGHGDKIIFEDQDSPLEEEQGKKTTYYEKIAPNNADFAFRFYRHIASNTAAKNIFFSPFSISTAFAMLVLGARSETQNQIYEGLAFNLSEIEKNEIHKGFHQLIHTLSNPNNKAQVEIGNAMFMNETLKILPKFLEDIKSLYAAEGFSSNFSNSTAAEKQINEYVQTKTHGKIAQAVENLDALTAMILINYIFFKAHWEKPFDPYNTREADFFPDANTTVKVFMMYRQDFFNFLYDHNLSCWVVEVPYKGDASAFFILPDQGKMKQVESALSSETLAKWQTSLTLREIHLFIPKLSLSTSYNVKDLLQKMGITDVFNENADLSGITGKPNLKVSRVSMALRIIISITNTKKNLASYNVMESNVSSGAGSATFHYYTYIQIDYIPVSYEVMNGHYWHSLG
uniref:Serpin domain-containing protein n=1 Tax=Anolis carolinensis TaxID=28377 RepID=A0A803TZF0_ANOCA